jgi:hypothetical protein
MRFQRGIHYPHPPRGPARKPYRMTDDALHARRRNLARAARNGKLKRLRSDRESRIIKLRAWQSRFESAPRPSERALARQLGVWPSYIHKLLRKALSERMEALLEHGEHITLDDLADAQRFTAKVRDAEADILAPVPRSGSANEPRYATAEDIQREAQELIRQAHKQNPGAQPRTWLEWQELERRGERRVLFSVPVSLAAWR